MEIVRFRNSLEVDYKCECDPEIRQKEIPKNILQPFVENALLHGLYDVETGTIKGSVTVSFKEYGDFMYIDIVDDGIGISREAKDRFCGKKEDKKEELRGKHVGMNNVRQRLLFIAPDITEPVTISDNEPAGTIIRIQLHKT